MNTSFAGSRTPLCYAFTHNFTKLWFCLCGCSTFGHPCQRKKFAQHCKHHANGLRTIEKFALEQSTGVAFRSYLTKHHVCLEANCHYQAKYIYGHRRHQQWHDLYYDLRRHQHGISHKTFFCAPPSLNLGEGQRCKNFSAFQELYVFYARWTTATLIKGYT